MEPKPQASAQLVCEEAGGTFTTNQVNVVWSCTLHMSDITQELEETLTAYCEEAASATGVLTPFPVGDPQLGYVALYCEDLH